MAPLPDKFADDKVFMVSGKTLNALVDAIRARTPLRGPGIEVKETPQGLVLSSTAAASEMREIDVCNNGLPGYRMVACSEAYDTSGSPP